MKKLLKILTFLLAISGLTLLIGLATSASDSIHLREIDATQSVTTALSASAPLDIGGCEPAPTLPITWSSPANISNNAGPSFSPALAVDITGTLHAVWYDSSISDNRDILYSNKVSGQPSWSTPVNVSNTPGNSYWPAVAIDPTGNVHVAWDDSTGGRDIFYAVKPSGGTNWTEPVNLSSSSGSARFVALAADGAGNVHAVWNDDSPGDAQIYYAIRPQGTITWTTPVTVASTPDTSWAPTIAADATGALHVAWHDFTPGGTEIYYATKPGPAEPWSSPVDVSRTTGASYFPALAVDGSGTVHLAWQDAIVADFGAPFEILYTQKPPDGDWKTYVNLSQGTGNAEMPTLAVGPEDTLHVAWDTTNDPWLFYVRRAAPEMGWTAPMTVTAISPGTQYPAPALAAGPTEAVHLLWSDFGLLSRDVFYSTAAPPPIPEDHVLVLDEEGYAVAGACVYQNGLPTVATDAAGVSAPSNLIVGDTLVALQLVTQTSTIRESHTTPDSDGVDWAHRTYLTDMTLTPNGMHDTHVITRMGQQRLVIKKTNPLILYNLLVSIEWDATLTYTQQISHALRFTSDYLYDFTDGQMALGQVAIYDRAEYWNEADIQISTKNIVRPHAYVGGITAKDKSHVIRVGRGWDGRSGNQGGWNEEDGYRTLAHEFGHYALHLYDEYFGYVFDPNGHLIREVPAYCTGPENRDPATDATNASVMDYQYTSTELSARNVPGLWSSLCEQTAQWQLNGESAWETLIHIYTDTVAPPRWQLATPIDRGGVLTGPTSIPTNALTLPSITISNTGASGQPRQLTVFGPDGQGHRGALVALYTPDETIDQGFTDARGHLTVYGANEGDTLRAASMDSGLYGRVDVGAQTHLTLTLRPLNSFTAQALTSGPRYMRVVANASPFPDQIDLYVFLHNFGPGADPYVSLSQPNSQDSYSPSAFSYDPDTDTYEGYVSFSATKQGIWRVLAKAEAGEKLVRLQSTYRLQRVLDDQINDVYSDDGNLSLHLDKGSLPGDDAYLVVMPPGALPGQPPEGLLLMGDAYDITASGALVTLEKPGILTLYYGAALADPSSTPHDVAIYRWDAFDREWEEADGDLNEEQKTVSAPVQALGTYALLAPSGPQTRVFLPVILRGAP